MYTVRNIMFGKKTGAKLLAALTPWELRSNGQRKKLDPSGSRVTFLHLDFVFRAGDNPNPGIGVATGSIRVDSGIDGQSQPEHQNVRLTDRLRANAVDLLSPLYQSALPTRS